MTHQIRAVESNDLEQLLFINELSIPAVNSISIEKFNWFFNNSIYFKLAYSFNNKISGFLLVLDSQLDYESLNYIWFKNRYSKFAYIDRIAILSEYQNQGIGKLLYADLERSIKNKYKIITCEYNLKPMNRISHSFHNSLGYKNVGNLISQQGTKEVSLMIKDING